MSNSDRTNNYQRSTGSDRGGEPARTGNRVKLAVVNIPAANPEQASKFYSELLNVDFTRSPTDATVSYGAPLSLEHGLYMTIKQKERPNEGITAFFAVDSLDETIRHFESGGGKLLGKYPLPIAPSVQDEYSAGYKRVYGDHDVPSAMGTSAVVSDSEGNLIGLLELDEHAHVMFKVGKHAQPGPEENRAVQEVSKSIEQAYLRRRSR